MTDEFDKTDKQKEIDDFFDKFDRISNVFDRSINRMEQHHNESDQDLNLISSGNPEVIPEQSSDLKANKTRLERLSESKPQSIFTSKFGTSKKDEISQSAAGGGDNGSNNGGTKVSGEEPMTTHKKRKNITSIKNSF